MVDRERVIKTLEFCVSTDDCRTCEYWIERVDHDCQIMKDALELLKEQPEIVRCKDCKYNDDGECIIKSGWFPTESDWFCADGEREEGDQDE